MKPSFTFECQNVWRFESAKHDQSSYVPEAEAPSVEKKSGRSNSVWKQFPMFDLNQKIETILGPMNRTGYGTTEVQTNGRKLCLGESSLSPHLIEFTSEEHQFQQQTLAETTKEKVQTYDSIGGSLPHTKEDSEIFTSKVVYKEHFANTKLSYLGKDLCNSSRHSTYSQPPLIGEDATEGGNSCHDRLIKSNTLENCCNVRTVRSRKRSNYGDTRNGKPQKYAHAAGLLFTKNMNVNSSHKDQMVGESALSANVKRSSFLQMLTLPALLHRHSQPEENLAPMVGSTNTEHCDEIVANLLDKQNENSHKTENMFTDFAPASSFPAAGTSSKSQKDVALNNANLTEIAGVRTSRSESIAVDHISCIPRPSSPIESTLKVLDATCKWVKRLRPNALDSTPATKKSKLGDSSSGVKVQNLVNQVAQVQSSSKNSAAVSPWIQRWRRQTQETSLVPMLCEPERSNVLPEKNLEAKQLPSLAAMALMGKSVNNFRPCEFRRRGSTTVWHTGEL